MINIQSCSLDISGKNINLIVSTDVGNYISSILLYTSSMYLKGSKGIDVTDLASQDSNKETITISLYEEYIRNYKDVFVIEVVDNKDNKRKALVANLSDLLCFFIKKVSEITIDCNCKVIDSCNISKTELEYINYIITTFTLLSEEKDISTIIHLYNAPICLLEESDCFIPQYTLSTINNKIIPSYV